MKSHARPLSGGFERSARMRLIVRTTLRSASAASRASLGGFARPVARLFLRFVDRIDDGGARLFHRLADGVAVGAGRQLDLDAIAVDAGREAGRRRCDRRGRRCRRRAPRSCRDASTGRACGATGGARGGRARRDAHAVAVDRDRHFATARILFLDRHRGIVLAGADRNRRQAGIAGTGGGACAGRARTSLPRCRCRCAAWRDRRARTKRSTRGSTAG